MTNISNTIAAESVTNKMESTYIQNLTSGLIHCNNIDGTANYLVSLLGCGHEKNNFDAINHWVKETIDELQESQENHLQALNQTFKKRIQEIIETNTYV